MHLIYRPNLSTKVLVCLIGMLLSQFSFANELPCGQRRLFKDGTELTSTYDAAYHYAEDGSVTMKDGFVAKPGFSIQPSLNCSQTRPALEELVRKHAPQIRHYSQENYHMASMDWFLKRAKIVKQNGLFFTDIQLNISDENIQNYSLGEEYKLTKKINEAKYGYIDSALCYVHIQRAYYQSLPHLNDDIEIQYWLFYPWNGDQNGGNSFSHEGDWEYVKVIVARDGSLKKVITSEHETYNVYNPDDVQMYNHITQTIDNQGTHPVLYSANESHALYNDTGWQHKVYDPTNNGGDWFDCWDNYEIIELGNAYSNYPEYPAPDKLSILNSGVVPTKPNWINFNGRVGKDGPIMPKKHREKWRGMVTYYDFDYIPDQIAYYPESVIIGEKSICYNVDYDFSLLVHVPYEVNWTAKDHFTVESSTNPVLTTRAKSSSYNSSGQIKANAILKYPGGFDVKYQNLKKNVWFGPPSSEAFTLDLDHEFTCSADASIMYNGAFDVTSVDWSIAGAADLPPPGERNVHKAALTAQPGGGGYTVYANVHNTCGSYEKSASGTMDNSCTDPFLRTQEEQMSDSVSVTTEPNPILLTNYQLFPNPTTGQVQIGLVSNREPLTNIRTEVMDYSGRMVDSFSFDRLESPYLDLDLSSQEKGLYLIRVYQADVPVFESKILKN
ncbi:Vps62-related protein [Reichenbachiella sp.]|uniref:Vps62-related protein n=1 Tax=Reichenbachiella sp. TaxID=2184521 RepID=UPI003BB1532F